jgi:tetratricopeptide (TPR) repeat protein
MPLTQADVAFYRGLIAREQGDYDTARALLAAAQTTYEAAAAAYEAGLSTSYGGRVAADTGQLISALDLHHTAFRHFLTAADLTGIGNELTRIGLILVRLDHRREALDSFQQALHAYQEAGNQRAALIDLLTAVGIINELSSWPFHNRNGSSSSGHPAP